MSKYGKDYDRERRTFKAESARANLPCWICNNTKGPIDYTSRLERGTKQPLLFNLDHAEPVSIGGQKAQPRNFRASHYVCNVSRGNTTRGMFPTSRQW